MSILVICVFTKLKFVVKLKITQMDITFMEITLKDITYMEMTQKDITCLGIAQDITFTILGITLKDIT